MRIYDIAFALLLAGLTGCAEPAAQTPQQIADADENIDLIECAIGYGAAFAPGCIAERIESDTPELIVRHPDGGFQRFVYAADGGGLITADGADDAANTLRGELLEVRVANNRYRFPVRLIGSQTGE